MADLRTTYLGLNLKNPLVAGASPFANHLDLVKQLEDNGVSAIVMNSLFEEEITHESLRLDYFLNKALKASQKRKPTWWNRLKFSALPIAILLGCSALKRLLKSRLSRASMEPAWEDGLN